MYPLARLCAGFALAAGIAGLCSTGLAHEPPVAPPMAQAPDPADLIERARASVVTIYVYDAVDFPISQGSGFFVSDDAIITNLHVVEGGVRATARTADGRELDVSAVLGASAAHDLAHLRVRGPLGSRAAGKPLALASAAPRVGTRVLAIGSPMGLELTVSDGMISSIREPQSFGAPRHVQVTAPISPGSSGGPVIDPAGRVIGVATSGMEDAQNLNFAVAAEHVRALLDEPESPQPMREWALAVITPERRTAARVMLNDARHEMIKAVRNIARTVKQQDVDLHYVGNLLSWKPAEELSTRPIGDPLWLEFRVLGGIFARLDVAGDLEEAVRLDPECVDAWRMISYCISHESTIPPAAVRAREQWLRETAGARHANERALRHVLRLDPTDAYAQWALAQRLTVQERWEEAAALIREGMSLFAAWESDPFLHMALGGLLAQTDRKDEAIAAAEAGVARALELYQRRNSAPNRDVVRRTYRQAGQILIDAQQPARAEAYLRIVVKHYPDDAAAFNHLGRALLAQDRLVEANDCLRELQRIAITRPGEEQRALHGLAAELEESIRQRWLQTQAQTE